MLLEKQLITDEDFYGDFGLGLPNPQEKFAEVQAWFKFKTEALPGILTAALAEDLGEKYVRTPANAQGVSQFVDGTGMQVTANQVAGLPEPPQQQMVPPGPPTVPDQMGGLPGLAAPGAAPLPGIQPAGVF